LETLITPFVKLVLILQKALIDIEDGANKCKRYLEDILGGLQKVGLRFVKSVEACLQNYPND
jgi:hypothetical protein